MEKHFELININPESESNSQNNNPLINNKIDQSKLLVNPNNLPPPYKNPSKKRNQKKIPINFNKLNNESPKYYLYKKIGNSFSFFGNKYGDPLFIIGPNWHLYIYFSFSISVIYLFIFLNFWNYISFTPKIIGFIIYFIFYFSYTYTFLINPGYPKHNIEIIKEEEKDFYEFCNSCKIWVNQQKNTVHCDICDICIEEFDHHCVWTSKCIGKNNICSFYIFLVFTIFVLSYAMITLFIARINFYNLKDNQ